MLAAIDKESGQVLFLGPDLVLTESGLRCAQYTVPDLHPGNCSVMACPPLPAPWSPEQYRLVGGAWALTDGGEAWAQEQAALALEAARTQLCEEVTRLRWERETGGITLPGGVRVATGTADQNRITSVIANAQLGGVDSVDFKAEGGWVTLSLDHLRGIAGAIALHVQACFSAERAHHDAITLLPDVAACAQYDIQERWPFR